MRRPMPSHDKVSVTVSDEGGGVTGSLGTFLPDALSMLVFVGALAIGAGGSHGAALMGPLSPTDALRAFELEPGLRVELVAAEPLTIAPCALAWDEQGRLYVAENRGYPTGGPGGSAVGVVAMFED